MPKIGQKLEKLVKIVERLRRECPWDREQTVESLKPYLVEEVYEALEAIDSQNYPQLAEELGDMLLHIVMLSVFSAEKKKFKIDQVIELISSKMVRRHPHVFGQTKAKDKNEVWKKWEKIKRQEKKSQGKKDQGMLDSIPRSLPALYRAEKIQRRAARVGFDWDQVAGAWDKVHEELDEVHQLLKNREEHKIDKVKVKEELGDLLFSIVNVTRKLEIDAEEVLQGANNKFIKRFSFIEQALRKKELTIEEMDRLWLQAKKKGVL
jgi:MazG family protein